MKKLLLLLSFLLLQGCIPALIIGGVMASNASKKSKSQWDSEFNKNNTEREKHHLKALDWCTEAYKVNKSWAFNNPKCNLKNNSNIKKK